MCGESHEDAIDVTRKGGYFFPDEGWIDSNKEAAIASLLSLVPPGAPGMPRFAARVVKQKSNVSSKESAKGWSRELIDNDERYEDVINESSARLFLVFLPAGKKGGHAFLLAFERLDHELSHSSDRLYIYICMCVCLSVCLSVCRQMNINLCVCVCVCVCVFSLSLALALALSLSHSLSPYIHIYTYIRQRGGRPRTRPARARHGQGGPAQTGHCQSSRAPACAGTPL